MGVVGSIVGVIFGVFWTIMATFFSSGMPQPMKTVFPLFGVLFIIVGIANVIYNLYNTTAKNGSRCSISPPKPKSPTH